MWTHRQTDRQTDTHTHTHTHHTHTHTHTHTQDNYCNPRCACVPRVKKLLYARTPWVCQCHSYIESLLTLQYKCRQTGLKMTCQTLGLVGASLSGPHTSSTVLRNPPVYIYIYMYVCMVHTSPPSPALWANVTSSMTSFNNSTWQGGWFRLLLPLTLSIRLMKLRKGNLTVRPV